MTPSPPIPPGATAKLDGEPARSEPKHAELRMPSRSRAGRRRGARPRTAPPAAPRRSSSGREEPMHGHVRSPRTSAKIDLGRRRMHDHRRALRRRSAPAGRPRAAARGSEAGDRLPSAATSRTDTRARAGLDGPARTMSATGSASGPAEIGAPAGRERAKQRLPRDVEDVDRPVAANGEITFAAGEGDRQLGRLPTVRSRTRRLVDLVEHDDGAVGSDIEGRRPDP